MKLTLLFVAAFVAGSKALTVSFLVDVLIPDLETIFKYNAKSNNTNPAYIYWPNSITLQVLQEDEELLKVVGNFTYGKLFSTTYSGMYYSDGNFYLKRKTGKMKRMKLQREIFYKQPLSIQKFEPYLAINYFSLEEMERTIKSYYLANQLHFDTTAKGNPATFLFTPPGSEKYFIEYMFKCSEAFPAVADGVIQVLIGFASDQKLSLRANKQAHRVVFDQETQSLIIPKSLGITSAPIANVVGVRMATTGYMAETRGDSFKRLNYNDFYVDSGIPESHGVSDEDLLRKVQLVEPRLSNSNVQLPKYRLLDEARFQIQGYVWNKKFNYLFDGTINKECPLIIELENRTMNFQFKGEDVTKLCTDDIKLWLYK